MTLEEIKAKKKETEKSMTEYKTKVADFDLESVCSDEERLNLEKKMKLTETLARLYKKSNVNALKELSDLVDKKVPELVEEIGLDLENS